MNSARTEINKVSVIIPAYNASNYLDEAVESIFQQDYSNWEIILIDDCSTDSTLEIALKYQDLDNRVKVFRNQHNIGPGASRELGVNVATGEFIAWLDADDIALPCRLSQQVKFLSDNEDIGVVGGHIVFFDTDLIGKVRVYDQDDESLRQKIFRQNPVAFPASTFRVEVFEEVGNFQHLRYCEDLEMLLRVGVKWKFANLPVLVTKYRQSQNSATQSNLRKMELQTLKLRFQYRKNEAYNFTLWDYFYNLIQFASIGMPVKFRMKLFALVRRDRPYINFTE